MSSLLIYKRFLPSPGKTSPCWWLMFLQSTIIKREKVTTCESKRCLLTAVLGTFRNSKRLELLVQSSHSCVPSASTLLPAYLISRASGFLEDKKQAARILCTILLKSSRTAPYGVMGYLEQETPEHKKITILLPKTISKQTQKTKQLSNLTRA